MVKKQQTLHKYSLLSKKQTLRKQTLNFCPVPCFMLVDLEVFYLGHLKNFYTIQYNTIKVIRYHIKLTA